MMNTVFSSKTRKLVVRTIVGTCILVALACVITPLTAFACDIHKDNPNNVTREQFATILKGFCQAFKADLKNNKQGLSENEFNNIVGGNSVKGVLKSDKRLSDSEVESFERREINLANNDFNNGTTYAPNACGQGRRDTATDKSDFQSYFNSQEYTGLDIGYIDSMFTDAVRLARSSITRPTSMARPKFSSRRSTLSHPCTDGMVNGPFDPETNTNFQILRVGGAPGFCREKVTWNFSNRTVGKDCTFFISPLSQTFTLNFINSSGQQIDSVITTPSAIMRWQENDIKQVQLDLSNQSSRTLTLGGIRYNC
ncbi:MAG TPA: hypothetical protein VN207_09055 [Ktedonobacteraceae bacterium]|nr:hypothetical protein [Ktedonobacteraceae bacterium]